MSNAKKIIDEILATLPWAQRQKVIEAGSKFKNEKLEKLTPEVVERLYRQVIQDAKNRGKSE